MTRRRLASLSLIGLGIAAVIGAGSRWIQIRLIDFEDYRLAAQMLWSHQSPYRVVEFFAPPWLALVMAPLLLLPVNVGTTVWLLFNLSAMGGAAVVATRWLASPPLLPRREAVVIAAIGLMPAAMYCYITGQISPLVGMAVLGFLFSLARHGPNPWITAGAVLAASLKVHIVIVPLGLGLLELCRRRAWSSLLLAGMALAAAGLIGFWFDPAWPTHMLGAWLSGDFRGGKPGLVSPGFRGLSEAGAPPWLFAGHVAYLVVLWWKGGLRPITAALAFVCGLLVLPYWRSYDLVVVTLAILAVGLPGLKGHWPALGVAILALLVLPLTPLAPLTPVVLALGLWWVYRTELAATIRAAEARTLG